MVQFSPEPASTEKGILPVRIVREIWREITFGVGTWGALRPLIAAVLAAVPFLFWDSTSTDNIAVGLNGASSRFLWPLP